MKFQIILAAVFAILACASGHPQGVSNALGRAFPVLDNNGQSVDCKYLEKELKKTLTDIESTQKQINNTIDALANLNAKQKKDTNAIQVQTAKLATYNQELANLVASERPLRRDFQLFCGPCGNELIAGDTVVSVFANDTFSQITAGSNSSFKVVQMRFSGPPVERFPLPSTTLYGRLDANFLTQRYRSESSGNNLTIRNGDLAFFNNTDGSFTLFGLTGATYILPHREEAFSVLDAEYNIIATILETGDSVKHVVNGNFAVLDKNIDLSKPFTNVIESGSTLLRGQFRSSPNRQFQVVLDSFGNIAVFNTLTGAVAWSSGTGGRDATELQLGTDGILRLKTVSNVTVWESSGEPLPGAVVIVTNSGRLVITDATEVSFNVGFESQCGTFLPYDAVNERLAPLFDGFSAGTYVDGSQSFVGLGENSQCNAEAYAPGRLTIVNPAGIHIPSCGVDNFESEDVKYLTAHPHLTWVSAAAAQDQGIAGLIDDVPGVVTFNYARVRRTNAAGVEYTTVGKSIVNLVSNPEYKGMFWVDADSNTETSGGDYEILACIDPNACKTFFPSNVVLNLGEKVCFESLTLVLQSNGNLVLVSSTGEVILTSNTAGLGVTKLVRTNDVNLDLQNAVGDSVYSALIDSVGGENEPSPFKLFREGIFSAYSISYVISSGL